MKRKTADSLKIPSETASKEGVKSVGNLVLVTHSTPLLTPFQELIEEWLDYCKAAGLSKETLRDYRAFTFKFYWWWTEHTHYSEKAGSHPDDVSTKHVREFAAYLRTPLAVRWGSPVPANKQELSPTTISTYGRHLKVFFNWLEQENYIERSPINRSVKFSNKTKQDHIIKLVAQEELNKLFTFLNQPERLKGFLGARDLAMIALLLDSGVRMGELLSIRNCDVDLKAGRCTVKGKTGLRTAIFGSVSKSALSTYIQHPYHPFPIEDRANSTSAFWVTVDGMPLTFFGCQTVIRRIREQSGVNFHAHKLRHTFATTMANQGVNLYDLKGLMGHTDIQTTQIYLHDNVDRLSEVYRLHSPLTAIPGLSQQVKKSRGRPPKWHE
jgi:integrase/recombinase XerD